MPTPRPLVVQHFPDECLPAVLPFPALCCSRLCTFRWPSIACCTSTASRARACQHPEQAGSQVQGICRSSIAACPPDSHSVTLVVTTQLAATHSCKFQCHICHVHRHSLASRGGGGKFRERQSLGTTPQAAFHCISALPPGYTGILASIWSGCMLCVMGWVGVLCSAYHWYMTLSKQSCAKSYARGNLQMKTCNIA